MNEENKRQKTTQYLGSCLKVNELPVNKNNNNNNFTTILQFYVQHLGQQRF